VLLATYPVVDPILPVLTPVIDPVLPIMDPVLPIGDPVLPVVVGVEPVIPVAVTPVEPVIPVAVTPAEPVQPIVMTESVAPSNPENAAASIPVVDTAATADAPVTAAARDTVPASIPADAVEAVDAALAAGTTVAVQPASTSHVSLTDLPLLALAGETLSTVTSVPMPPLHVAVFAALALFALTGRHRLPELTIRIPSPITQTIPVPPG